MFIYNTECNYYVTNFFIINNAKNMDSQRFYTTLQKGTTHTLHCQDSFLTYLTKANLFFSVVADGCSGGIDSQVASSLTCKLIRKILKENSFDENFLIDCIGKKVISQFMVELKQVKEQLRLSQDELLSTLILSVWKEGNLWVSVLGDGVVSIQDKISIFDQQNQPDYPVYHLSDDEDNLQLYLNSQILKAENVSEFSISTDGILSFKSIKEPAADNSELVLPYFLTDNYLLTSMAMLSRKCNILHQKYGLQPADDLAIARFKRC